jgi:hypothetical protein
MENQSREGAERADQRDRHDQDRNQRRSPALQEQIDDEDHEHECDDERLDDLLQRLGDERRRAVGIE